MSEMKKRLIMCVAGVFLSGVAAGTFGFTAFGMDPFQVFAHGLWGLTPLSFGTFYVILNGILLGFMAVFNRRMIGLGTLINLFLTSNPVTNPAEESFYLFPECTTPANERLPSFLKSLSKTFTSSFLGDRCFSYSKHGFQ